MELSRALEAAVGAAREAGAILRADFHRPDGPRGHADKAEADVEAEQRIRELLCAAFPEWGFLGEETGRVLGAPGAPIWLVDPNDGTRDYLVGRRGSSVSIGLVSEGHPRLGVVYAFAYPDDDGDLFTWAEGCGPLLRNGQASPAALPEALSADDVVLVSSKGDKDAESNLRCADPARYRTVPSIAHRLALVAAGEAAAATSLFAPGAWDYAAGHALLRAADAVLVDEERHEIRYADDGESGAQRAFGARPALADHLARQSWDTVGARRPWGPGEGPLRPKRGASVADAGLLARAQGALLGQIAGDSLGSLVEFAGAPEIAARYPEGPRLLADGGVHGTLAGQPTDDSELALTLGRAIVAHDGFDAAAVLTAYRDWYRSGPFDVGQTTRAALVGYLMGESQANGSLMRASSMGVFAHALPPEVAARLASEESALTHPNRVCRDAVASYVVALAHAVRTGAGARSAYDAALEWATAAGVDPRVKEALQAAPGDPPTCDGEHRGSVLLALRNAFHVLLHARSLEEGVVRTVRRGGDTDTNAAIAGALLGAVHGREAVPRQWRQMILSCRPHPLRAKRPRPMAYWPIDVYELAERLLVAGRAQARQHGSA